MWSFWVAITMTRSESDFYSFRRSGAIKDVGRKLDGKSNEKKPRNLSLSWPYKLSVRVRLRWLNSKWPRFIAFSWYFTFLYTILLFQFFYLFFRFKYSFIRIFLWFLTQISSLFVYTSFFYSFLSSLPFFITAFSLSIFLSIFSAIFNFLSRSPISFPLRSKLIIPFYFNFRFYSLRATSYSL